MFVMKGSRGGSESSEYEANAVRDCLSDSGLLDSPIVAVRNLPTHYSCDSYAARTESGSSFLVKISLDDEEGFLANEVAALKALNDAGFEFCPSLVGSGEIPGITYSICDGMHSSLPTSISLGEFSMVAKDIYSNILVPASEIDCSGRGVWTLREFLSKSCPDIEETLPEFIAKEVRTSAAWNPLLSAYALLRRGMAEAYNPKWDELFTGVCNMDVSPSNVLLFDSMEIAIPRWTGAFSGPPQIAMASALVGSGHTVSFAIDMLSPDVPTELWKGMIDVAVFFGACDSIARYIYECFLSPVPDPNEIMLSTSSFFSFFGECSRILPALRPLYREVSEIVGAPVFG
jgi:hypothetical protein